MFIQRVFRDHIVRKPKKQRKRKRKRMFLRTGGTLPQFDTASTFYKSPFVHVPIYSGPSIVKVDQSTEQPIYSEDKLSMYRNTFYGNTFSDYEIPENPYTEFSMYDQIEAAPKKRKFETQYGKILRPASQPIELNIPEPKEELQPVYITPQEALPPPVDEFIEDEVHIQMNIPQINLQSPLLEPYVETIEALLPISGEALDTIEFARNTYRAIAGVLAGLWDMSTAFLSISYSIVTDGLTTLKDGVSNMIYYLYTLYTNYLMDETMILSLLHFTVGGVLPFPFRMMTAAMYVISILRLLIRKSDLFTYTNAYGGAADLVREPPEWQTFFKTLASWIGVTSFLPRRVTITLVTAIAVMFGVLAVMLSATQIAMVKTFSFIAIAYTAFVYLSVKIPETIRNSLEALYGALMIALFSGDELANFAQVGVFEQDGIPWRQVTLRIIRKATYDPLRWAIGAGVSLILYLVYSFMMFPFMILKTFIQSEFARMYRSYLIGGGLLGAGAVAYYTIMSLSADQQEELLATLKYYTNLFVHYSSEAYTFVHNTLSSAIGEYYAYDQKETEAHRIRFKEFTEKNPSSFVYNPENEKFAENFFAEETKLLFTSTSGASSEESFKKVTDRLKFFLTDEQRVGSPLQAWIMMYTLTDQPFASAPRTATELLHEGMEKLWNSWTPKDVIPFIPQRLSEIRTLTETIHGVPFDVFAREVTEVWELILKYPIPSSRYKTIDFNLLLTIQHGHTLEGNEVFFEPKELPIQHREIAQRFMAPSMIERLLAFCYALYHSEREYYF